MKPRPVMHRDYMYLGRMMAVLAAVVLFIGTMVTGSGPHGGDADVQRLGFAPHVVTKVHGSAVWLLLLLTALTLWRISAADGSNKLMKRGEVLIGLLLAQGAIGYFQYALNVPVGLVIFHIAGAVAVWLGVIWFNLAFYERNEDLQIKVYDGDQVPDMQADMMTNLEDVRPPHA